jgi:hypothetical protein
MVDAGGGRGFDCNICQETCLATKPDKGLICGFHSIPGRKLDTSLADLKKNKEGKCWCGADFDVRIELEKTKAGAVEMWVAECIRPKHFKHINLKKWPAVRDVKAKVEL